MPLNLNISPRIIPNIASLYNDVNRIVMEYIDNSFDSAEKIFNNKQNSYIRNIKISIKIEGETKRNRIITITDNCEGISDFNKVIESIGNSDKKSDYTTNGQFGYGIYSYLASCSLLKIQSKVKDKTALEIEIPRSKFDEDHQKDVLFDDPREIKFNMESGTIISLHNFEKDAWKQIELENLKNEIENHFGLLLKRGNISIEIESRGKRIICKGNNYDERCEDKYEDTITEVSFSQGRKYKNVRRLMLDKDPIEIKLYITKGKVINKPPVFIVKGRRISEIGETKSFKSVHKSDLWKHPNLTGYIDLRSWVEPNISRIDFKPSSEVRAIFDKIIEMEEVILDEIKEINKKHSDKHYNNLENYLNRILEKLSKRDEMKYAEEKKKEKITNKNIAIGSSLNTDGEKDFGEGENSGLAEGGIGTGEGSGKGYGETDGPLPGKIEGGDKPFIDDIGTRNKEKGNKKAGFYIRISDREPDLTLEEKKIRSEYIDGEIVLFRRHPDFEDRAKVTRKGEVQITDNLINYIVSEIAVHYKDLYFSKKGFPNYDKKLFVEFTEFIYDFEKELMPLTGKNLNEISYERIN